MNPGIRRGMIRAGLGALGLLLALVGCLHLYLRCMVTAMPGRARPVAPNEASAETRAIGARLRSTVEALAADIGSRSIYNTAGLRRAEAFLADEFRKCGLEPHRQAYVVEPDAVNRVIRDRGTSFSLPAYGNDQPAKEVGNIWVEISGRTTPERMLVVGAHYDTVGYDCPGANDNAAGMAGVVEIARFLQRAPPRLTVLLAAFTCEEYLVGGTNRMGSAVFVERLLAQGRRPVGMIALDTIGCYSGAPGSQQYPFPLSLYYPDRGDFVCFVGDATSRTFVRSVVARFRQVATVPSEGIAAPYTRFPDVLRSDHEYFIRNGIPGLMVTDTANFRYAHYHHPTDTPDKLDFDTMARVVESLGQVVQHFE